MSIVSLKPEEIKSNETCCAFKQEMVTYCSLEANLKCSKSTALENNSGFVEVDDEDDLILLHCIGRSKKYNQKLRKMTRGAEITLDFFPSFQQVGGTFHFVIGLRDEDFEGVSTKARQASIVNWQCLNKINLNYLFSSH